MGRSGGRTRAILSIDANHGHSVTTHHYFGTLNTNTSAFDFEGPLKLLGHLGSFNVKIFLLGHHLLLLLRLSLLCLADGWLRLGLWQEVGAAGHRNLPRVFLTV